jgi:hypothetical protein
MAGGWCFRSQSVFIEKRPKQASSWPDMKQEDLQPKTAITFNSYRHFKCTMIDSPPFTNS